LLADAALSADAAPVVTPATDVPAAVPEPVSAPAPVVTASPAPVVSAPLAAVPVVSQPQLQTPEPTQTAEVVGLTLADSAVLGLALTARVDSIQKLVSEGQERLSQEISKSQTQTVRNVSGLAHDVDRLMTQLQGLSSRIAQTESTLARIEATLVPLSRAISASLLPSKPAEKVVTPELLESRLATAMAPILAELIELRALRARESSLAQVEQQILLTELKRLRNVALPVAERTTDPLLSVGKTSRRLSAK
jgi:hypothetical protein